MNMFKKILCLLVALFVFAVPMSVSAEGETNSQYNVSISATVDGAAPQSGEFIVTVSKQVLDDETYGEAETVTTFPLNSDNGYTQNYSFTVDADLRYVFSVSSSDSGVVADDHMYYVKLLTEDGLVVAYENENESVEIEPTTTEGVSSYELVFNNSKAPALKEITAKAVDGKKISKVYDGNTDADVPADCYELVGVDDGEDVKLSFTSAKFNDSGVKNANAVILSGLSLSGNDAAKYKLNTEKVQIDAEITPRTITVTADDAVMTLGDKEPTFTYKVSGELIGDDKLIGDLARTPGNEVGQYVITIGTLTLSGNSENYDIVFKEGTFTVSNYSSTELTDPTSKISVKGYFDASSTLTVNPISATDSNYKTLFDNAAWGKMISAYSVTLNADSFDGDITVTFPIPSEYIGKEVAVYQLMSSGAVTCFKTEVASGTVSLTTSECTQFMLVVDKDGTEEQPEEEKRSAVATVFIVLLIILGVIVGLALLIVVLFFGMVFFNKTEELKAIIRGIRKLFRK